MGSAGCPKCTRPSKQKKQRRTKTKPWEQDENYDGVDLDLPEDDTFDYDQFLADEFGAPQKRTPKQWMWWATAVILLIAVFYYLII